MIKLTIEIKDEKFQYSYDVAGSSQSSDCQLTPEGVAIFTNCLMMAQKSYVNRHEEWMEELKAKAYIEKHPEILKETREQLNANMGYCLSMLQEK